MVCAIVCADKNWSIGYKGNLLVHIPEDMRFFRNKTVNNVVIMGRKTYDSLPSRPLPYRTNIVITSKVEEHYEIDKNGTIFVSMDFIKTLLENLSSESSVNFYIIGGGQIYKELLPCCNRVYVTKVNYAYENVDTYFQNLDKDSEWSLTSESEEKEHIGIKYKFTIYDKK